MTISIRSASHAPVRPGRRDASIVPSPTPQSRQAPKPQRAKPQRAKPQPPTLSEAAKAKLDGQVAGADDDIALGVSKNAAGLATLTAAQKARLVQELISGSTNDKEDLGIARILESCTSKAELDEVLRLAGGYKEVLGELDHGGAISKVKACRQLLTEQEQAEIDGALTEMEGATSREEVENIINRVGGTQLKYRITDPKQLDRLRALAEAHGIAGAAFDMAGAEVVRIRHLLNRAAGDSELATKLAESEAAMAVASPEHKAGMIRELQDEWTKDRHDMAIYKILSTCRTKAELDRTMSCAGGASVIQDVDLPDARNKLNALFGGWGRVDLASDRDYAEGYEDVLIDPASRARYGATRPPTAEDVAGVGGTLAGSGEGAHLLGHARAHVQSRAFDVGSNAEASTTLILENRKRELAGVPLLDVTSVTVEVDAITSAAASIKDPEDRKERVEEELAALAKERGISKQTLKSIVTQRMTQAYGEASSLLQGSVDSLEVELARVQVDKGEDSREARALEARIAALKASLHTPLTHVRRTSATLSTALEVPKSTAEVVVDVARVALEIGMGIASLVPGAGQAIAGAYAGIKAVAAGASGDFIGMFAGLGSALAGIGGALGSTVLNTAGHAVTAGVAAGKAFATGDLLGGLAGIGSVVGAAIGPVATKIVDSAKDGLEVAKGVIEGDIAGVVSGFLDLSGVGPDIGGALESATGFVEALGRGDISGAIGAAAGSVGGPVGGAIGKLVAGDVMGALGELAPMIEGPLDDLIGEDVLETFRELGSDVAGDVVGRLISGDVLGAVGALAPSIEGPFGEIIGGLVTGDVLAAVGRFADLFSGPLAGVAGLGRDALGALAAGLGGPSLDGPSLDAIGGVVVGLGELLGTMAGAPSLESVVGAANGLIEALTAADISEIVGHADALADAVA